MTAAALIRPADMATGRYGRHPPREQVATGESPLANSVAVVTDSLWRAPAGRYIRIAQRTPIPARRG